MGLNLYRGFESLGLRQLYEKRPLNQWAFFFEKETAMSLRTSRVGFEGLGLQAKPRPAVCRRIPRSPPVIWKTPAEFSGRFL